MRRRSLNMQRFGFAAALVVLSAGVCVAQQAGSPGQEVYTPTPSCDLSSMDTPANPCQDFYKYSCGHFSANHPIPADQGANDGFYNLYNVNTQELSGILEKAATGGAGRTANEQKIGDYYHACMDVAAINAKGLEPLA